MHYQVCKCYMWKFSKVQDSFAMSSICSRYNLSIKGVLRISLAEMSNSKGILWIIYIGESAKVFAQRTQGSSQLKQISLNSWITKLQTQWYTEDSFNTCFSFIVCQRIPTRIAPQPVHSWQGSLHVFLFTYNVKMHDQVNSWWWGSFIIFVLYIHSHFILPFTYFTLAVMMLKNVSPYELVTSLIYEHYKYSQAFIYLFVYLYQAVHYLLF